MEKFSKPGIAEVRKIKKGVSIVVCTFNGSERLAKTIQHISAQTVSKNIEWEVIFVDNASTDNSTEVVKNEWSRHGPENVDLFLLNEKRPGKIFALEQAFSAARYEYAIICDDDNWLSPGYLENVYEILEKNEKIGAVGGRSSAVNHSGKFPAWFEDLSDSYAVGRQALTTGDITDRGYLWGAGMATRTATYREMYEGFPSLLTGRLGETLAAGEDAEYCQRLVLRGYILYYDSRLFFQHYMPDSRLTKEYTDRLFAGFAESNQILNKYNIASRYIRNYRLNNGMHPAFFAITTFSKLIFASNRQRRKNAKAALVFANLLPGTSDPVMTKIRQFYKQAPSP